ncbi:MAG: alpha/beta fold hydrolase BchO, partial [Sandaracinobacteroides sp.]
MTSLDWARDGSDWPNRQASRFVQAGGLRWHVQEEGVGPTILLLHGTGAATHSWRNLWSLLLPHGRLIAPDLPGHGFTARPADLSLNGMAAAVSALLDQLAISPDIVIGHSAGAAVAARMALDGRIAPGLLVGIGGALEPFPGPAAFLFPAMAKLLLLNPIAPQLFTMTAGMPGEARRFLARSTGSVVDAEGARLYGRLFRNSAHVAATLAMMSSWDLVPLARDLPKLVPELLLIHGTKDNAVPARVSVDVANQVDRGRSVLLPGLGHLPHEEDAAAVATVLLDAMAIETPEPIS